MAATTWVASHEIVEAVTDPAVGQAGKDLAAPLAWYDPDSGELSDACAGTAQIQTFVVQTQESRYRIDPDPVVDLDIKRFLRRSDVHNQLAQDNLARFRDRFGQH